MSTSANKRRPAVISARDADGAAKILGTAGMPAVQELAYQYLRLDGLAHFFLETDLRILWRNDASEALFARQSVFKEKGGRLRINGRENGERFKRLITQSSAGERVCLECEETKRHILLDVMPLLGNSSVVLTAKIAEDLLLTVDTLSAAFGLTAAESALVQNMFLGMTAEGIALRMGVSINTMRTHIRNIYGKLSVSSREGMMNRLLPYVVP